MTARALAIATWVLACSMPAWAQEAETPAPTPSPTPAPTPNAAEGELALRRAYEKEYAYLTNEATALEARLEQLEASRAADAEAGEAELDGLERRLRELRDTVDGARERLLTLEAQTAEAVEGEDTLHTVLAQANATLAQRQRGVDLDQPAPEAMAAAIEQVGDLLVELGSVRRHEGRYFLRDGREAEGPILELGAVAALAAGPDGAGALAPAGDGARQLWTPESEPAARAALNGELPAVLPLYVYEGLDKPAERRVEQGFAELVAKAGVIGYVIVGLGALAGLLLVLRAGLLARAHGRTEPMLAAIEPLLRAGDRDAALAWCAARRAAPARVLAGMLPHLDAGTEALESAASESLVRETLRIERCESAIMVAAAVAPLLGLLGTVTGMIATFDVITVYGTGDPKLLSGGISEALITTQLGLAVAIPALLAGNLLGGWASRIRADMEQAALRLSVLREALSEPPTLLPAAEVVPEPVTPARRPAPAAAPARPEVESHRELEASGSGRHAVSGS